MAMINSPDRFNTTPQTKPALYRRGDKLIGTKLRTLSVDKELRNLFREIDKQYEQKKRPTERQILEEIRKYRHEKAIRGG